MQGNQKIKIMMDFQWKLLVFLKIIQCTIQEENLENVSENDQFLRKGCAYLRKKVAFHRHQNKNIM